MCVHYSTESPGLSKCSTAPTARLNTRPSPVFTFAPVFTLEGPDFGQHFGLGHLLARSPAGDVTRFLLGNCPQRCGGAAAQPRSGHAPEAVLALRSFLRFCHLDGVIPAALNGAEPTAAAGQRMGPLPGHPGGDLDRLLAGDRGSATRR